MKKSDTGIDGVHNPSWPATRRHYERLYVAGIRAGLCFKINDCTRHLEVTWEGNHWGLSGGGVPRRLGEFPREEIISRLRVLRQASREGLDPLTLSYARMKPAAILRFRRLKATRLSPLLGLIPNAFIDRRNLTVL